MFNSLGLLLLRLGVGFSMLLAHGWPKLINFTTLSTKFPDPIGIGKQMSLALAVTSEFFCSIALILGLFTRWVSVPLLITMLVIVFLFHGNDPWKKQELAALYGICYLVLILTGGGKFSLDALMRKKD